MMAGGVLLHALNLYLTASLLPSVVDDIGGRSFYAWTTTAFLVLSVIGAMVVSQLLARLGTVPAYLVGFGAFAVGSVISAAAPTMAILLVGRGVQGLGGGLLGGLAFAIMRSVLPQRLWTRALGLLSGMYAVGTLIGPSVGGGFAQVGAWRLAFVVIAGVAVVLALVAVRTFSGRPRGGKVERVPLVSVALLTAATGALSVASIVEGAVAVALLLVLAGLVVVGFVAWEKQAATTVLPRATYERGSALPWYYLTMAVLAASVATEAFTPLLGQEIGGLAPFAAGFLGAGVSVGWSATNLFVASVTRERTQTVLIVAGPVLVLVGLLGGGLVAPHATGVATIGVWAVLLVVVGAGIGVAIPQLAVRTMSYGDDPDEGDKAAASINTTEMVAMSMGSAVGGVLLNLGMPSVPDAARNLHLGLAVLAVVGVLTAIRAVRASVVVTGGR